MAGRIMIGAVGWITLTAAAPVDPTGAALARCLAGGDAASTGGQSDCAAAARQGYDRLMNRAYARLLRRLPADAAQSLRRSQRAWLAFRMREDATRAALFATRSGTMYAPMQAAAEVAPVRDRALMLETYLRVIDIEG
jgi:uncharacterized protein YecT (DUF1311 family)